MGFCYLLTFLGYDVIGFFLNTTKYLFHFDEICPCYFDPDSDFFGVVIIGVHTYTICLFFNLLDIISIDDKIIITIHLRDSHEFCFLMFSVEPYFSLHSTTLFINFWRSWIHSDRITISSAYFILLMGVPLTLTPAVCPSRAFWRIFSDYALKSIGDRTHLCLTPLFISISSDGSLSTRTVAFSLV